MMLHQVKKSAVELLPRKHAINLTPLNHPVHCPPLVCAFEVLHGLIGVPSVKVFDATELAVEFLEGVAGRDGFDFFRAAAITIFLDLEEPFALILEAVDEACDLVVSGEAFAYLVVRTKCRDVSQRFNSCWYIDFRQQGAKR